MEFHETDYNEPSIRAAQSTLNIICTIKKIK